MVYGILILYGILIMGWLQSDFELCWILIIGGILLTGWLRSDFDPERTHGLNYRMLWVLLPWLQPVLSILAVVLWVGGLLISVKSWSILAVSAILSALGMWVYIPWVMKSRRLSDRHYQAVGMYALLAGMLSEQEESGMVGRCAVKRVLEQCKITLRLKDSEVEGFVNQWPGDFGNVIELAFKRGVRVKKGPLNTYSFVGDNNPTRLPLSDSEQIAIQRRLADDAIIHSPSSSAEYRRSAFAAVEKGISDMVAEAESGSDDDKLALRLFQLAILYKVQGKYAESEPLLKRSLNISEKLLGPNHPNLATSLENYAEVLRNTNRLEEAEMLEKRAKSIREGHPNDDHHGTDDATTCPFCAETIKKAAILCKHCRSDLSQKG